MSVEPIAPGLWCVNSHFRQPLRPTCSVRMSVLGGAGGVLLYSPVLLDAADIEALEAIGPVTAIIAPNLYHHFFLRAAADAFPAARVFVPEGLEAKIGPIPRAEMVTPEQPPALPAGIEPFTFDRHAIHETMLFHRASRTLVTSDLLYNYQAEHYPGEKAMFRLIGCYGAPSVAFYHRFVIRDKAAVKELVAQVREWAPRRIVMSHGRIVEDDNAAEIFAAAWQPFS
jgi:glyoxylase-like metal-dependent hydrolase (beta-lactamase superfamily II)